MKRGLRHEWVLFIIVVLETIFFSRVGYNFATRDNAFDILRQSVEVGFLALVMTPVILTGGIDLSVGSLMGLCSIAFGKLWRDAGLPIPVAGLGAIAVGGLAGGLNAALITKLRLPPLIVTLGTYSLFRGLAEAITHGVDTFTGFPGYFLGLGQDRVLGVPEQAPIFVVAAIGIWLLVHRTSYGRSFRAIGYSPEGARYAGIPVDRRIALVYILAGIFAAVAAITYTARLGQARSDVGIGYELYAITAVVLGGCSIFGGSGTVHGTLLGAAAIAILNNGFVQSRYPREVAGIFTGILLIVALAGGPVLRFISRLRPRTPTPP